ncbi:MAG: energy transducer TonB, partial [Bacteroidota bacterium]
YAFILAVGYLLTDTPETWKLSDTTPIVEELEVSFEDEALAQLAQANQNENSKTSEEVRNLLASSDSKQVDELVNYSGNANSNTNGQSDGASSAEQYKEKLEQELFTKHESHGVQLPSTHPSHPKTEKSTNSSTVSGGNTSYSGNVSVSFSLPGRSIKNAPKPTYKCKGAGTVVVMIIVNELGVVTEAKVDAAKSSKDACLTSESLAYASRWKFSDGKSSKQPGTITFQFSAQ